MHAIARSLGRAASTISREVDRGGRRRYRAAWADQVAWDLATRPKPTKLRQRPALAQLVAAKLSLDWSPQQIAGWLKTEYPDDPEMQVSHETTYRSMFVQSRGELRKELTRHLRTGRATRRPAGQRQPDERGGLPNILHISQSPAEAADRAVLGHWEISMLLSSSCSGCRRWRFLVDGAVTEHRPDRGDAASGEGDEGLLVGLAFGALQVVAGS
jgi:IS30 family transposase